MPAVRLAAIHRGDLVFVNQRGRLFYAKVLDRGPAGELAVEPLDRAVRARRVRLAEVAEHWARSSGEDPGPAVGQISLAELDGWTDAAAG